MSAAAIAKELRRMLTADEAALVEACGPIPGLALICIQEGVSLRAATRIATIMRGVIDYQAMLAARIAADVVAMERRAPGSVADEDPKQQ